MYCHKSRIELSEQQLAPGLTPRRRPAHRRRPCGGAARDRRCGRCRGAPPPPGPGIAWLRWEDPGGTRIPRARCATQGSGLLTAPGGRVLPLSDGVRARRFPVVNVLLIAVNFAVWIFCELPRLDSAIYHASFYPCTVDNACRGPEPWGVSWITAMFLHGSWDHILGNMLFLAIFGKNVEDAFRPLRYLAFYFAGGFIAMMTQAAVTLLFGTAAQGQVPNLGASGAIAAVLGAYILLYPRSRILTVVPFILIRVPAWIYLGLWFLYQLIEANFGLFSASAPGGGIAFFAHVGGFLFGMLAAWLLARAGWITSQER